MSLILFAEAVLQEEIFEGEIYKISTSCAQRMTVDQ